MYLGCVGVITTSEERERRAMKSILLLICIFQFFLLTSLYAYLPLQSLSSRIILSAGSIRQVSKTSNEKKSFFATSAGVEDDQPIAEWSTSNGNSPSSLQNIKKNLKILYKFSRPHTIKVSPSHSL